MGSEDKREEESRTNGKEEIIEIENPDKSNNPGSIPVDTFIELEVTGRHF